MVEKKPQGADKRSKEDRTLLVDGKWELDPADPNHSFIRAEGGQGYEREAYWSDQLQEWIPDTGRGDPGSPGQPPGEKPAPKKPPERPSERPPGAEPPRKEPPSGGSTREKKRRPIGDLFQQPGPPPPEDTLPPMLEWKLDWLKWLSFQMLLELRNIAKLLTWLLWLLIPGVLLPPILLCLILVGGTTYLFPLRPFSTPTDTSTPTVFFGDTPTFTPTVTSTPPASGENVPQIPGETGAFSGKGSFGLHQDGAPIDPAGHLDFIKMWAQGVLAATGQPSAITFIAPPPWVTVTGVLNPDGTFSASGTGTVAGFANIRVEFHGTITGRTIIGDYTMGVGGGLPTNQAITYHFAGSRSDVPPQAIPAFLQSFLDDFVKAIRTNDVAYLVAHLHPEVLKLYGKDQCQSTLAASATDPSFQIQASAASGPATWIYGPDGRSIPVNDVYTVTANETAQNQSKPIVLHFGWIKGQLYWFTDCGNPLP